MSLPPGFLNELRNRVPISKIIGRKVTWDLRKSNQAKGDWWAPCPFHSEKSPSFHVDDQKGFYYCFGCHAKGDALTFLREADGMSFIEAVKTMASEAGMTMPDQNPAQARRSDHRTVLAEIMEQAVRHYRTQFQTGAAAEARDYLSRRDLDQEALDQFEIGFAPDQRQGLLRALRDKGIAEELILEAGLVARPDRGGDLYDRFRGRIMFPIRDARGRAIAFGGRAMDPNARAKYLNSPETALFDKGRNLYNLGPARSAVAKGQKLVVAEGYMDVIALVRAGFGGAVAPLGTAITEDQLRLMWRVSPEPVVALDGDSAGLRAAIRLIDMALPMTGPGQALRFAMLPGGQDPDDYLQSGGAGAMTRLIDEARPLVDLLWTRETEGRVFDSPERRAALDQALRQAIALIPDDNTRNHYAQTLKEKRYELFGGRRGAGRITPGPRDRRRMVELPRAQTKASAMAGAQSGENLLEAMILAICAHHPNLIAVVESRLERLDPVDSGRAALCHDLLLGVRSASGQAALDRIMADAHIKASPLITDPDDVQRVQIILANAFDKIESRRAIITEIARAEHEITGLADEGLTWRVGQLTRARHEADHPRMEDTSDLGEDRNAMAESLRQALANQIWNKKPRR